MNGILKPAEAAHVRVVSAILPDLQRADLVFAALPDGEEILVKGRSLLGRIVEGGRSVGVVKVVLSTPTIESAAAMEQVLGHDGNIERHTFGNTVYGRMGNA